MEIELELNEFTARVGCSAFILCILVLCCVSKSIAAAPPLQQVRLQLKWGHQFQFAGYYVALEKGYYRDVGLDVAIFPALPGEDVASKVLDGQAEYGVGTTELMLRRAAGEPVVVLGVILQHSPLNLVALKGETIQSITDLSGQAIMIESGSSELLAYFRRERVDLSGVVVAPHQQSLDPLLARKVDAMSVYDTDEPYLLGETKVDHVLYSPRSAGIDFYGDNLFTTENEINNHRDRVSAFREASFKGWAYAMEHPEEVVQLIYEGYSKRHSLDHLRFEARQMARLMHPSLIPPGHMYQGRWRHIADVYAELGMMEPGFDLTGFLFDPSPKPPDYTWLVTAFITVSVVSLAVASAAVYVTHINLRLKEAKMAAELALVEKQQFLSMASHEVKGALAAIDSTARLLRLRFNDQPDVLALCARIVRAVTRMSSFIDNFMIDGRLDAAAWEVTCELIPVACFLQRIAEEFGEGLDRHHIQVAVSLNDNAGVRGDRVLLEVLIRNLLDNAVKYSPGGGTITLAACTGHSPGLVAISVSDKGIGIDADELSLVAGKYYRGTTVGRPGFGIGLFLVSRIAELHQATLSIDSKVGMGTKVEVVFGGGIK